MRGRPGRRRRRARATGFSPVGTPWAGAEAAYPRAGGVALCATTALAGAVPRLCVRGARGRFGGFGPVPGVVSLPFPSSRPACPALRVAGCPVRVSLTLARWYAIPRGLCVPRARSGCPSGCPRVPFLRHGGPPPKALHQSGLTMGKISVHGEPKFSEGQPRVFTNLVRVKTLHELHHGPEKVKILVEAISVKDAKGYIAYTKAKWRTTKR